MLGRRLAVLPLMILGITALVFVVGQGLGDQARAALGPDAGEAALSAYRQQHGLDQPLIVQYLHYLGNLVTGNLGETTAPARPITDVIGEAFPLTLQLTFLGVVIAVVISLVLGVLAALYRDRWVDQVIRVLTIAAIATPSFWLGILLIQWFALGDNPLFPASGITPIEEDFGAWLNSMTLPAIALAIPVSAGLTRVVRTSMVEELDRDYVRTAIGNGVPYRTVVSKNVLRNALITPLTVLGLRVGYLLGGAVVIEQIFNIPGMGKVIFTAITGRDLNQMMGVALAIALTFVLVNLVVDFLYVVVNPRIRSI